MAWILLLLAVGCFLVPYFTTSFALGVLCMLLALVFVIVAMMMLLSARIGGATRNVDVLSPHELRILREQADADRTRAAANAESSATSAAASSTTQQPPPSAST